MKAIVTSLPQGTGPALRPLAFAGAVSLVLHGSLLAAASWLWPPAVPPQAPPMVVIAVVTEGPVRPKQHAGHIAPAARKNSVHPARQGIEKPRATARRPAGAAAEPNDPERPLVRLVWDDAPPTPPKPPSFRLHRVPKPPRPVSAEPVTPDPRADKPATVKSTPATARAGTAEGSGQIAKVAHGETAGLPGASRPVAGLGNPAPDYPWISRRRGEQGRVILEVGVSAEGRAKTVRVKQSSGWARLDQAALAAVKRWKFSPAMQNGRAVPGRIDVPVSFRLMK